MTVDDFLRGESKNVEFKSELPKNSEKYVKTAVAFANTQGGKLFIGVEDGTREIIGVDDTILFQTMDAIADAISDSCEPQIIPEIEPYTIGNQTVIVVTIAPGAQRPYFLKSKGKEKGTFVRVGATSRPATSDKIRELELEGARISWDEQICIGYNVTENAVNELCREINASRKKLAPEKDLPLVTATNLVNWKVLRKAGNGYLASNAFALLTESDQDCFFPFSRTQCAVFKGTDRAVFLDKREYVGPIFRQIDEAVDFVLRNIRLGAKIEGLIRKESYELPPEAIREMIVNAHCHRNLTDESCVQVALYDDRLEVASPGGLYNGLTLEDALLGHSKLRNRVVANLFRQMGLIEAWGSGLQRIRRAAKKYELQEPEFVETANSFRVCLYRKNEILKNDEVSKPQRRQTSKPEKLSIKSQFNSVQLKILDALSGDPRLTATELAERLDVSPRYVETNLDKLKKVGVLVRNGAKKTGYWEIVDVRQDSVDS